MPLGHCSWPVSCLIVAGNLPGTAYPPAGILGPTEVEILHMVESVLIAVVIDRDRIGLVGLQVQLDGSAFPGLGIGVGAVGSINRNLPGAICSLGSGLAVIPTEPIRFRVGEGAFGLGERNGFGTRIEPIGFRLYGDGAGAGAGAAGCRTCGKNHAGEDGDDCQKQGDKLLCH